MQIETLRFGVINYNEDHVIHFRDGIIGLSQFKDYVLVESPGFPLVVWLQSLQDLNVAFPLIEPYFFNRDYKVAMTDADRVSLSLEEEDRSKIMVILTIPNNFEAMTVNMKAPIAFNVNKSLGTQVVLQDKTYQVRTPAHEAFHRATSAQVPRASVDQSVNDWSPIRLGGGARTNRSATL